MRLVGISAITGKFRIFASKSRAMTQEKQEPVPVGRYAPSPTGRMHFGNIFTAVLSWLSVRSRGGRWVLRIEDLDPQRSKAEYARQIEDDLDWLGLSWDEGGTECKGSHGPYCQSLRHDFYERTLAVLAEKKMIYPCFCRRADILATQAPHAADGRVVYSGRCRPAAKPPFDVTFVEGRGATRLFVPDEDITFTDGICGPQRVNLAHHCGDFLLRRADGAWSYQLAVVADDAAMGITEVLRGNDLLLSAAQQIYLYRLLGYAVPEFVHTPLVCNAAGQRLSKRDNSMSMEELRCRFTPAELLGKVAFAGGLTDTSEPCTTAELLGVFDRSRITRAPHVEPGFI